MNVKSCKHCHIDYTNPVCPRCGRGPSVSDPSSTVEPEIEEQMVRASRPSLASLIKAGVKKGLIQPIHDYASKRVS